MRLHVDQTPGPRNRRVVRRLLSSAMPTNGRSASESASRHAIPRSLSMPSKYPTSSDRNKSPAPAPAGPLRRIELTHRPSTNPSKPSPPASRSVADRTDAPVPRPAPAWRSRCPVASPVSCVSPLPCAILGTRPVDNCNLSADPEFHHRLLRSCVWFPNAPSLSTGAQTAWLAGRSDSVGSAQYPAATARRECQAFRAARVDCPHFTPSRVRGRPITPDRPFRLRLRTRSCN